MKESIFHIISFSPTDSKHPDHHLEQYTHLAKPVMSFI